MQTLSRVFVLFTALISIGAGTVRAENPPSPARSSVTVQLRDGRKYLAYVDHRTDDETLWIRFQRGPIALSAGYTWDLVDSVVVGEERFSAAEFREQANHFASTGLDPSLTKGSLTVLPILEPPLVNLRSVALKVQTLSIEGAVANWDRDSETDGIEVRILPRAFDDRILPVNGTISVVVIGRELFSERIAPGFTTVGSWSQAVRAADFAGHAGAVYRLPFRNTSPDANIKLQSIGMMSVTLNAAGHGEFHASCPVRIRTFNPIHDELLEHRLHHDSFGRYRARHW